MWNKNYITPLNNKKKKVVAGPTLFQTKFSGRMWQKKRRSYIWEWCFYRQWKVLNSGQNVPKVLVVVFHRPPDRIGISLSLGLLFWSVLYLIGCSSGIVLSGLQEGRGDGVWVGSVIGIKTSEQDFWEVVQGWKGWFGWMIGRWDVTLYFLFIV